MLLKYLDYIEYETNNIFLKRFYNNLLMNLLHIMSKYYFRKSKNFYSAIKIKLQESFQQYWHELISTPFSIPVTVGGNKQRKFALLKHTINAH